MAVDEFENALRKLLDEAVIAGLRADLLITVVETELARAVEDIERRKND